jgi:hypothetical protein
MKFLAIVRVVASLLPILFASIRALEQALPQKEQGSLKRELLREILQDAYDGSKEVEVSFAEAWPSIEKAIAGIVSLLKKIGEFKN